MKNKKIVVIAESGSDITPEIAERYGIYVVPMYVSMKNTHRKDGSFPVRELLEYYDETGTLPQTSASGPQDFTECYREIHAKYPEAQILHLAYSAVTTCSFQNAVIASESLSYVTHIDTKSVSAGQAAVVIRTAEYLEQHPDADMEELLPLIEGWIEDVCMVFLPKNLMYLKAGGRVSNAAYLGASILSLKPLIEIVDGKLIAGKKYRGKMKKVIPKVIMDFFEKYNPERKRVYGIWSEGFGKEQRDFVEAELRKYGVDQLPWIKAGSVITVHGGPGAFGLTGFSGGRE